MFFSFQTLRVIPTTLCLSPACLPKVLEQPIIHSVPVEDIIGIPYGFDLQLTEGFYVTLLFYLAVRTLLRALARVVLERRAAGDE